ncbi:adhesion G-protein coupled receptor G7 [Otolemur garnettii]|uniref:adhesion G-protein coupled receptor G7 n=1 Tax=Otolemur garnettii TaxID=30611 RepID=UPI000C7F67DE|nr:adhesion G-protein coupled receptor G7 [Otolemur garnettii]
MENYSLSLDNELVEPNVAIRSVNLSSGDTEGRTSVLFSVQKGSSNSLVSGSTTISTNAGSLNPNEQTELQILVNTNKSTNKTCGFVVYQNNKLFQSKTFITKSNFSQKIISSKTNDNKEVQHASVEMVFSPKYSREEFQLYSFACVFWNFSKNDWDTYGCDKVKGHDGFLQCRCNHTTNFAVLMTFKKNYQYPASLDIASNVGCALSIFGLALTIIFQIVTRKVRKTSVTWVLVNLCTSMLIFNLLFVFGIENSNKNLKTITHGLLQLIPVLNKSLILFFFITLGVPAIIVAVTVGAVYAQNSNDVSWELVYRQETICWLAIPQSGNFIKSPSLWSFIIPITIILISNIVIFIIITVKVLWKNNQNLTSTKKTSSLKKIISTFSIAIVFGITWVLGYLMLIENDTIRTIFGYIFCIFNTTQGFLIFLLYTVRTKIFQSRASEVLKSLSTSAGRMTSMSSVTRLRLRVRMYNMLQSFPALQESFRLLEPTTKEEILTYSYQENSGI